MKGIKKIAVVLLLMSILGNISVLHAADPTFSDVQTRVTSVKNQDPTLPSTQSEQKGKIGTIISGLFDSAGKIKNDFLGIIASLTSSDANSIIKWDGTKFQASSIFDDGTNVGIGTSIPNEKLHIANGWAFVDNGFGYRGELEDGTVANMLRTEVGNELVVGSGFWNSMNFHAGTADRMYIDGGTGNVGIGNTSPSYKLDVNGDINFSGDIRKNGTILNLAGKFQDGATAGEIYYNGGNVGIGTNDPNSKLDVDGNVNITGTLAVGGGISGDSITDETIDSSEIEDGTILAVDLAPNSVGNSELIDTPTFSELTFANLEPSDITTDGNIGFDSSRGLIINRTQQVGQESGNGTYTVLDTSNITGGTGVSISNTTAGTSGIEAITFSVDNIPGDSITDGTIDSSEIEDNTLTASDIAANSINGSELNSSSDFVMNSLNLNSTTDASISSTANGLIIGPTTGDNLALDGNEIMARNNGIGAKLYIQNENTGAGDTILNRGSGNVGIGTSSPSTKFNVDGGEVRINNPVNATYNPSGYDTHFNHGNLGRNYIRGQTEIRGKFYILDGNVGIGTASPAAKLHIVGTTRFAGGSSNRIDFVDSDHDNFIIHQNSNRLYFMNDNNNNLSWDDGDDDRIVMMGQSNGVFLGIGTSTPTQVLDVRGGASISGNTSSATFTGNGASITNVNATTVDGIDSAAFLRSNTDDTFLGKLSVGSTNNRRAGMYGIYDSTKVGHIWSMGNGYQIPQNGANFGNIYGFAYKHTNNPTGGTMAGGHQAVWAENGIPRVAIGSNLWVANDIKSGNIFSKDNTTHKYISGGHSGAAGGNILMYSGGHATTSNRSDIHFRSNNTSRMKIDGSSGNVGIGTSSPGQKLDIAGTARATAFVYSSDERLKINIESYNSGKSVIEGIETVRYDWKDTERGSDVGVIAQDVQKVFPEAVKEDSKGYLSVDYSKLVVPLIQMTQDQQKQIDQLQEQVELLLK